MKKNVWLFSVRQALFNLVPYYIASAGVLLVVALLRYMNLEESKLFKIFNSGAMLFSYTTPVLISILVSYFLAVNFSLNRMAIVVANFLFFLSFYWVFEDGYVRINTGVNFLMLLCPIVTVLTYRWIIGINLPFLQFDVFQDELRQVFSAIVPVLITLFVTILSFKLLIYSAMMVPIDGVTDFAMGLSIEIKTFFRTVMAPLIWWATGIHGANFLMSIFGEAYLSEHLVGNLSAIQVIDSFGNFGGTGGTLSLIIAIIFFVKDPFIRKIAFISMPFSFFNISEILMYALPVILNVRLLIPLLCVPLINVTLAYGYFYVSPALVDVASYPWVTPPLLSGYLIDGQFSHVLLQLVLIVLGVAIYRPFILKFESVQASRSPFKKLQQSLALDDAIQEKIQVEVDVVQKQRDAMKAERVLMNVAREIQEGELLLYYQPKINIHTNRCYGYEALLRLKKKDGNIVGPFFLPAIENTALSVLIDLWVIQQVEKDCIAWEKVGFKPKISINLLPSSLANVELINKLINRLKKYQVEVEIVEKTFAHNVDEMVTVIERLRSNGLSVSIDDFGSEYSSLKYLSHLPVDTVKLDRGFLKNTATEKGKLLYQSISLLCRQQKLEIVAEGVETVEQLAFVSANGIFVIQGFYFSKAIPFEEVRDFSPTYA